MATAAAEIETVLRTTSDIVAIAAKFLRDIGIAVAHALTMHWVMHPITAITPIDIVDVGVAINVDGVAAPIKAATPITARGPSPERVAGAECKPSCEYAGANIGRRRPVVWRIGRIRPRPINYGRIKIGHVHNVGLRWRDDDNLLAVLLLR